MDTVYCRLSHQAVSEFSIRDLNCFIMIAFYVPAIYQISILIIIFFM